MKEKLISRLVMGALVGLAATGAYAGQIQSASTSIAREVITADTQAVVSPSISYRFAGDVNATVQNQTFQVQFTLADGAEWASIGSAAVAAPQFVIADGVTGAPLTVGAGNDYTVDKIDLSGDKKTLFVTVTVLKTGAAPLVKQPIVTIASSGLPAENPTVVKLKTIVGDIAACNTDVKKLGVSFKHYVALSDPSVLASDTSATPDEHTRGGSTNATTLITFPTNIAVKVTKAGGNAKLRVSGGNIDFTGSAVAAAPDFDSFVDATHVNLGAVSLVQNAAGYDSDVATQYLLGNAAAPAGLKQIDTAAVNNGKVEVKQVDIKVSASQGFVVGGDVYLSSSVNCAGALAGPTTTSGAITTTNAAGPFVLSIKTQADLTSAFKAAGTGPVYVCYHVPGTAGKIVPGSSFNVDSATVVKADAGAGFNEQNNSCNGAIYPLSGSIKIDVRNFADASRTDGWVSVVRLINNSEIRNIDVYGQYIHADGKYGKWGKVATLAPRAVLNMTSAQIDAKLATAPTHAVSAAAGDTPHNPTTQDAPRLRLTTENGDTLRVQNYLYNPASQNFIEASGSQGVDFTDFTNRTPSQDTTLDQDAQVGLNGGN